MVDASLNFLPRRPSFGPVQRRRAALLAGSMLFYVAILTPLALRFFEPPPPGVISDPLFLAPMYLEMEPRPLLPGERARTRAPAASPSGPVPTLGQALSQPSTLSGTEGQNEDTPPTPSPRIAADPAAGAPAATVDPWQVTPETMRAAVARSMRLGAAGCRAMDGRLSPSEQRLCDDRFNEAAGRAGPLGPRTLTAREAERQAELDREGAQALARYERNHAPPSGGSGIVGASPDCPGGNLRGSCAGAFLRPGFEMTDDRLRNNRKME